MRWLVNENVSATFIRALRERGHDVLSVKELLRGTGDAYILALAQSEERKTYFANLRHCRFNTIAKSWSVAPRSRMPSAATERGSACCESRS